MGTFDFSVTPLQTICPIYHFSGIKNDQNKFLEPISQQVVSGNGLIKLFETNNPCMVEKISPYMIFMQRTNVLYRFQHYKSKSQFLRDRKVQIYFGTKDANLLGEYYDFIRKNKNVEKITKYDLIDFIKGSNANFIKGCKMFSFQGEKAEKLVLHMLERELGGYSIREMLVDQGTFPPTLVLNKFTNNTDILTDAVFKFPDTKKRQIIKMMKERDIQVSRKSVDRIEEALKNAIDHIIQHSLDINGISSGTDRLTLIIPVTPIDENNDLAKITNFLSERIQEKTFMNTIGEYKLNLSKGLDQRIFITEAKKIVEKGNENSKLILGRIGDYPAIIRTTEDKRLFTDGIGLGRIDRLKRDWTKLAATLGIHQLFNVGTKELSSTNAADLATDDFKSAISKDNFGKNFSNLLANQKHIVDRIITGYVQKMENSIAQHQIIEFMRSGRWVEVTDLGITFSSINTVKNAMDNNLMTLRCHDSLGIAEVNTRADVSRIIQIPLRDTMGNTFFGIIDKDTFFAPQTIKTNEETVSRFGITKFIDQDGIVRYFDDPNMFSIIIDDVSLFSRAPLKGEDLYLFREYQKQVYNLLFHTPNQGHQSNFILGKWMPEINILTYAGATIQEIENLLQKIQHDFPVTYNHYRLFDVSIFKLKWNTSSISHDPFVKIVERTYLKNINPIILSKPNQNGETIEYTEAENFTTTTRMATGIEYVNNYVPVKGITSSTAFIKFLIPKQKIKEYLKGRTIDTEKIRKTDTDTILHWFAKFPIAHRSNSNKFLPSPLGGLTTEIYAGIEPPIPLVELVEATKGNDKIMFFQFRPPTGSLNDYSLMVNKKLTPKTAKKFIQYLQTSKLKISFIATFFNEIKNYLDPKSVSDLTEKHHRPFEMSMIEELKQVANGNTGNLAKIRFKKEFMHMKNVYVWFDPKTQDEPVENTFSILDLRILPGHFPQYPENIDPEFLGTKYLGAEKGQKYLQIFKNREHYLNKIHFWIEALLRRILHHLTLDADLFQQNLQSWNNAKPGGTNKTFEEILGKRHTLQLAKRYLAPGCTLTYDVETGKMTIKKIAENRVFRFGAFLTPIFLHPQIFAENKKKYREIVNEYCNELTIDTTPEPVIEYRRIFETTIDKICQTIDETKKLLQAFQNLNMPVGMLRVLFNKI